MLTVVCVLKSGGDYFPRYVEKLMAGVAKNLSVPYRFVCYTDMPKEVGEICEVRRLTRNLKGWWSKVEIFKEIGPTLFFDLDTFILGSIDNLAEYISSESVYMLHPMSGNDTGWASGIMAWEGDYSYINNNFSWHMYGKLKLDQKYIAQQLDEHHVTVHPVQAFLPGIESYKFSCKDVIPYDTRIVCFHGKGYRPHEIKEGWVKEMWDE